MTHPHSLIHPFIYDTQIEGGLTKREYFAASADALIEALNKQEVKP